MSRPGCDWVVKSVMLRIGLFIHAHLLCGEIGKLTRVTKCHIFRSRQKYDLLNFAHFRPFWILFAISSTKDPRWNDIYAIYITTTPYMSFQRAVCVVRNIWLEYALYAIQCMHTHKHTHTHIYIYIYISHIYMIRWWPTSILNVCNKYCAWWWLSAVMWYDIERHSNIICIYRPDSCRVSHVIFATKINLEYPFAENICQLASLTDAAAPSGRGPEQTATNVIIRNWYEYHLSHTLMFPVRKTNLIILFRGW